MQYGLAAVFHCPENCIACPIGRDTGRRSRKRKTIACFRGRTSRKLCIADRECLDAIPYRSKVHSIAEVGGHGKDRSQRSLDFLVDMVRARIELPHGIAVDHINIGIFPGSAFQRIVAFGLDGNDAIIVDSRITKPTELHGNGGNDTLLGDAGADSMYGGDGNDTLIGGPGADSFDGGAGDDYIVADLADATPPTRLVLVLVPALAAGGSVRACLRLPISGAYVNSSQATRPMQNLRVD